MSSIAFYCSSWLVGGSVGWSVSRLVVEYDSNNTRFIELEVCAVGNRLYEFCLELIMMSIVTVACDLCYCSREVIRESRENCIHCSWFRSAITSVYLLLGSGQIVPLGAAGV
jgi:hypothetical protein